MNKQNEPANTNGQEETLRTAYPLCEKDEQVRQIDLIKKLQTQALKAWRALKKDKDGKITGTH